jgi:hypothetical protein
MKDIAKLQAIISGLQMELDAIRSDYERLRKHHGPMEAELMKLREEKKEAKK